MLKHLVVVEISFSPFSTLAISLKSDKVYLYPNSTKHMRPIKSFSDHPMFKRSPGDYPVKTVYLLEHTLYVGTDECLSRVRILQLSYNNLGEPFREFARVTYETDVSQDSIDVSFSDAAILYFVMSYKRGSDVLLDKRLKETSEFLDTLEEIMYAHKYEYDD
jgi:hypothetical protein